MHITPSKTWNFHFPPSPPLPPQPPTSPRRRHSLPREFAVEHPMGSGEDTGAGVAGGGGGGGAGGVVRGAVLKALVVVGGVLLLRRLRRSTTRWDHARAVVDALSGEKVWLTPLAPPPPPEELVRIWEHLDGGVGRGSAGEFRREICFPILNYA